MEVRAMFWQKGDMFSEQRKPQCSRDMFSRESERLRHHAQARAPLIDVRGCFGKGRQFF